MTTFDKNNKDPLEDVIIKVADTSHIYIKNNKTCIDDCENKPCTYYCPSRVYSWSGEEQQIEVAYQRCIECGACPWGCPYDNIKWEYPPGGYGICYMV